MAAACRKLLEGPCVVRKRSKSGEKDVDIRPMIHSCDAACEGEDIVIRAVLTVGGDNFLNPEYLVTFLKENERILAGSPVDEWYSIRRTGVYFEDMTPFH